MSDEKIARIRELNDAFRRAGDGMHYMLTASVHRLPHKERMAVIEKVIAFDAFTADNDPYGEHEFGAVEHNGETFFWKIDYYDKQMAYGSEDPSDPSQTTRVMTIMRAEEY